MTSTNDATTRYNDGSDGYFLLFESKFCLFYGQTHIFFVFFAIDFHIFS